MTTRDRFLGAAGVAGSVFLLYLLTLAPSAAMWDAGEYIAAAKSLGVPHQPGNPLFVLVAHVAGMIPLSPDYATRINILAALASAVTAGLWFLVAERLLRSSIVGTAPRVVASGVAALLGATAFTVWNQSVVMEKVYPLALVGLALTSWLVLLWIDSPEGRRADKLLALVAYLTGLIYAVHPAGLLTAPAVAAAMLARRPGTFLRGKLIAMLVIAFVAGASPFLMIPIRSAHQPYVNVSAVSACEDGKLEAGCTFSGETVKRLVGTIQREQYGGNAVIDRRAPFQAQVQMFWLYFKWQWMRDSEGNRPFVQSLVAAGMLMLGAFGLFALRGRLLAQTPETDGPPAHPRAVFWYFAALTATFTVALIYYLNFRYGWSQRPDLGDTVPREPRDRDYFFMWTFSLWGLLAGLGFATLAKGRKLIALSALALLPLLANWSPASRAGQTFTREWAADLLSSIEPNGIIITNGDNDSFPLWYAQAVEGIRQDVTIALAPYLPMDWYARQLNKRTRLWNLSDGELDTIPPVLQHPQPVRFEHGAISTTIPPGFLTRDQLLVLRAIKDSFPSRPIYFSFGPYPQRLGLGDYVTRVGLVQKLHARPVSESPDSVRTPAGYVDVQRSLALWKEYRAARQLVREGKWTDIASADVPLYYAMVGQELAMALDARGDRAQAMEIMELVRQIADVVQ
jgi:hypothetical protein